MTPSSLLRRLGLVVILCLTLIAGATAIEGYTYLQEIEYSGCDQGVYQQDIVIHRATSLPYNETIGGLDVWHIYVGDHCREDYGDIRFVNSTGRSSRIISGRATTAAAPGSVCDWRGRRAPER